MKSGFDAPRTESVEQDVLWVFRFVEVVFVPARMVRVVGRHQLLEFGLLFTNRFDLHLRGFDGRFSIEPELIIAIPPALAQAIIRNRGWLFPLPPAMLEKVRSQR